MEPKSNPMEIFSREAPEVTKAFDGLVDALRNTTGLDAKQNNSCTLE